MNNKKSVLTISLGIIALLLIAGCAQNTTNLKRCTQEAKICQDGSAVGRTDPNCEFAPCPKTDKGKEENKTENNERMLGDIELKEMLENLPSGPQINPNDYPKTLGKYSKNGLILIEKYFCSDVCPQYGGIHLVYKDIKSKEECAKISGDDIIDPAWGGYIGCSPIKTSSSKEIDTGKGRLTLTYENGKAILKGKLERSTPCIGWEVKKMSTADSPISKVTFGINSKTTGEVCIQVVSEPQDINEEVSGVSENTNYGIIFNNKEIFSGMLKDK